MRKALLSLFGVGLLGALLIPSCVIKETSNDNGDGAGGSSSDAGGSGASLYGSGAGSTSVTGGGEGGVAAATTLDACTNLNIKSDDGTACSSTSMSATYSSIHMLIVLDKSGSMDKTPEGFGQTKWAAMQASLTEALNASSDQVGYGLLMYPYMLTGAAAKCELPTGKDAINVDVDVATNSVPLITEALKATAPGGGTPTAAALAAALDYYTNGLGASLPAGDKYVLLATDGGPNCNSEATCDASTCTYNLDSSQPGCSPTSAFCCPTGYVGGPEGCIDDANVLTQINNLKTAGIRTFVVGIPGSEAYESYLTAFAEAGGATNPAEPTLKYYAVTSDASGAGSLTATLKSITESLVRDCDVKLAQPPVNPLMLNVAVECKVLVQGDETLADADKNWVYNGDSANPVITIQGDMCKTIQTQGVTRVDVIEGCTTMKMQ